MVRDDDGVGPSAAVDGVVMAQHPHHGSYGGVDAEYNGQAPQGGHHATSPSPYSSQQQQQQHYGQYSHHDNYMGETAGEHHNNQHHNNPSPGVAAMV
jgi:hypothetical protein